MVGRLEIGEFRGGGSLYEGCFSFLSDWWCFDVFGIFYVKLIGFIGMGGKGKEFWDDCYGFLFG